MFVNDVKLPSNWEYWEKYSIELLSKCDVMAVVCLPGWETSVGVTAEIAEAKKLNKRIFYFHEGEHDDVFDFMLQYEGNDICLN